MLKEWKCDVVCVQETKNDRMETNIVQSSWGYPYFDRIALDDVGKAGEVLLMQGKRVLDKVNTLVGIFSLASFLKGVENDFEWVCTRVHGQNDDSIRSLMREELKGVR